MSKAKEYVRELIKIGDPDFKLKYVIICHGRSHKYKSLPDLSKEDFYDKTVFIDEDTNVDPDIVFDMDNPFPISLNWMKNHFEKIFTINCPLIVVFKFRKFPIELNKNFFDVQ